MSETTIWLIGIAVVGGLIFLSAARTLGEITFLLALLLIGGGYAAVLVHAFFGMDTLMIAVALTLVGIAVNRLSAANDIPAVRWRAAGLHATVMACTFSALAFVTFITSAATPGDSYPLIAVAYGVLAAWHWIIALRMAARVMSNYDGKSK